MNELKKNKWSPPNKIAYTKTFYYPDAIVHVHSPDISDEENERRMKLIKQAATELIKEKIKWELERKRKEHENHEAKAN